MKHMNREELFEKLTKPTYDEYLMSLTFLISLRSQDQSTRHGCVIADENHKILSTGYNGPPRGCIDDLIPKKGKEKYLFMKHAEKNAILSARGVDLTGSTFYITGHPCADCFGDIIQVGAKRVVYGPVKSGDSVSHEHLEAIEKMLRGRTNPTLERFSGSQEMIKSLLESALDYFNLEWPNFLDKT